MTTLRHCVEVTKTGTLNLREWTVREWTMQEWWNACENV